ncbi:hypothetical protein [Microbacterium sp. RURRCA19A]|uniref:hypothetical protein n=1 Tax=Microbacterium sp. RURRCA19A TaxID=1907391 RepID=UPI000954E886|nr:hypothetical protein [Microbacterium sp. RURRCA19A]SIS17786.1 hypothetical protein SAMN05880568_3292 [Microbacterium sp. RURRCA19A]
MPTHHGLPPVPRPDQTIAEFIREHSAEEFVELVGALIDWDTDEEPRLFIDELCEHVAPHDPEFAMRVVELLLVDTVQRERPLLMRRLIVDLFPGLLCRGIDRIEEIAWALLLEDPDDDVFEATYSMLEMTTRDEVQLSWTTETYDHLYGGNATPQVGNWSTRLTHILKLRRARARHQALQSPATSN